MSIPPESRRMACLLVLLGILRFPLASEAASYRPWSSETTALGTFVRITVEDSPAARDAVGDAFQRIQLLESRMSRFLPDSELSLLNRDGTGRVSPETQRVLKRSLDVSRWTGGAFDITCGPLVELYRRARSEGEPPSPAALEEALGRVGWRRVQVGQGRVRIGKGMSLDLGGIAKGFIVDEAAALLRQRGVRNGLVEAGGDIFCFGTNPEGRKWRIGVRDPKDRRKVVRVLEISERGVATSGDYEQYVRVRGTAFGHIVDPRTGRPAKDPPLSVTIVADDCATADALATGCFVLGTAESLRLLETLPRVSGFLVSGDLSFHSTSTFPDGR